MTRKTFSSPRSICKLSLSLATEPGVKNLCGENFWWKVNSLKGLAWTFNFERGGDQWQWLSVCPYTQVSWWHRRNGGTRVVDNGTMGGSFLRRAWAPLCLIYVLQRAVANTRAYSQLLLLLMTFLEGEDLIESIDADPRGSIFSVLLSELGRQVLLMRTGDVYIQFLTLRVANTPYNLRQLKS